MKNILKYGFLAISVAALTTGCIKEEFPTSVASNEQVAANPTALESMVNGMHAFVNKIDILGSGHYDWGYPAIGLIRDVMCEDMTTIASGYDWFSSWATNRYQSDQYIYGQFIWNFYTQFLQTANAVIGAVPYEGAQGAQAGYLAMAYCYRAMINLDMGRMYEYKQNAYTTAPDLIGKTIPIIREDLTESEARNNPRADKADLLEFIQGDLTKAIALFKNYNPSAEDEAAKVFKRTAMNQPDLSVAYGLQARAYMWAEDYVNAKIAAQNALSTGAEGKSAYTPLTEAQWTDTKNGFNNADSQKSWMWASILTSEDEAVKSGLLNFTSWLASETTFGYAAAGPYRLCDVRLYSQIKDYDFRKKSWVAPKGSSIEVPMIASNEEYDNTVIPEYAAVKFRPATGEVGDNKIAAAAAYPMMRCEEMYFIIAECDAHAGSKAGLEDFMQKYRYDNYSFIASDANGGSLLEEVLLQKRIEFWGEGIVFYDYKRLNKGVNRAYEGSNHFTDSRFVTNGLAPWMCFCIVRSENNANPACISNPDPSDTVESINE